MANAAPSAPSSFVGDTPIRILDTRTDVGLPGPFVSGVAQKLQVTGTVSTQPPNNAPAVNAVVVPTTATSVVLNVTVVRPSTAGFISIRPGDAAGVPATSNINWGDGGPNVANSVTVQLPAAGNLDIYVQGAVGEVLVDIAGYYESATPGAPGPAGPIGPVGPAGPVSAQIVPINYRAPLNDANAPLVTLNGITVLVDCVDDAETIKVTTTKVGGEVSSNSFDASEDDLDPFNVIDDDFNPGDTFIAGPGFGNAASDRQYTITYAAPDGKNVNIELTTEDSIGPNQCVVSGFAIGAP